VFPLVATLLALALLSCATNTSGPDVEIVVRQMPDNYELLAFPGRIAIRYQVTVGNPSDTPMTIERLELRSNGPGPYTVQPVSRVVNLDLAPREIVTFDFFVDAISRGDERIMREPVTLSGTAYFRTENGPFSRSFIQVIRSISEDARTE